MDYIIFMMQTDNIQSQGNIYPQIRHLILLSNVAILSRFTMGLIKYNTMISNLYPLIFQSNIPTM
jgi:hypothetical protein